MSILYLFHHRLGLLWLRHVALDEERVLQLFRDIFRTGFVLPLRVSDVIDELPVTSTTFPVKSKSDIF